jgi:hypothetical protein
MKMLLRKKKITEEVVKLVLSWRHSGFNVHCGPRIQSGDEEAMEDLTCHFIPASFSRETMSCVADECRVIHQSKGKQK